jgi:PilZ domain-containing protein
LSRRGKIIIVRQLEPALKQQDLLVRPIVEPDSITKRAVQEGDRRNDARFSVSASAEIVELRSRTRLIGRASDLSSGGCYVDTMTPFPLGASVMLTLSSETHNVQVKANVVYARIGMGMGLAFTEMTAKQKDNLTAWLHELIGESPQPQALATNRPYLVLEELISLLRVKRILSDSEVELLREKMSK